MEGLGNRRVGANPIQKRLAEHNASQCGYCTPGVVINMYSLLKNNPRPSKEEIEKSFDGNICRCTGYRAILESMKTFAADETPIHDIEDLMQIKCLSGSRPDECCHDGNSCDIISGLRAWHSPTNLPDLISTVKRAKDTSKPFKLVGGNTAVGVYKNDEDNSKFDALINVKNVQELNRIEKTSEKVTIGSAVSISDLIKTFETSSKEDPNSFKHLKRSADHLRKVASGHVRNIASWSGNLALKRQHPEFPSDVLVILESIGAKLNVIDFGNEDKVVRTVNIDLIEYLSNTGLKTHLIESMDIPKQDQSRVRIDVYKTAHRSQNSHSYVNSGFRFEFESGLKLKERPVLMFNGLTDSFNRATKTEEFLAGKSLDDEKVLKEAIKVIYPYYTNYKLVFFI